MFPFNKPAPTDLNLLSSQRKKIHLKFNMSLSILQKKIYISKKVGAFHWRCNGIAKVIDFHYSEVMMVHTIGISNIKDIKKLNCCAYCEIYVHCIKFSEKPPLYYSVIFCWEVFSNKIEHTLHFTALCCHTKVHPSKPYHTIAGCILTWIFLQLLWCEKTAWLLL